MSSIASGTLTLAAPTSSTFTVISDLRLTFSGVWGTVAKAIIQLQTSADGSTLWTPVQGGTQTGATSFEIRDGAGMYYRLIVVGGDSGTSVTWSAFSSSADGGILPPLGLATAANSLPVVIASDQVLPLPTGAATAALQTTGNTSLASIITNLPALLVTTLTTTTAAITATDSTPLAANSSRTSGPLIMNVGAGDVTLNFGTTAVAGQGIILKGLGVGVQGASWSPESGTVCRQSIHAICASGITSTLAIVEGT